MFVVIKLNFLRIWLIFLCAFIWENVHKRMFQRIFLYTDDGNLCLAPSKAHHILCVSLFLFVVKPESVMQRKGDLGFLECIPFFSLHLKHCCSQIQSDAVQCYMPLLLWSTESWNFVCNLEGCSVLFWLDTHYRQNCATCHACIFIVGVTTAHGFLLCLVRFSNLLLQEYLHGDTSTDYSSVVFLWLWFMTDLFSF